MQTLNTLSTPEEKLAALCKKYAELVSASPSPSLPLESQQAPWGKGGGTGILIPLTFFEFSYPYLFK